MANWTWQVHHCIIAGAAAGAHSLKGGYGRTVMKSDAVILNVSQATADLQTIADLTSEFSRVSDTSVDNTSGTDSTGDSLIITWAESWD